MKSFVSLVSLVQVAGGVHFAIVAMNALIPRKLDTSRHLSRLTPILRQVFLVHWIYILFVLVIFGALCLVFPAELAGGSALGRTISGFLAAFWIGRLVTQLLYYDRNLRRENRFADVAMAGACVYMGAVFVAGAFGAGS